MARRKRLHDLPSLSYGRSDSSVKWTLRTLDEIRLRRKDTVGMWVPLNAVSFKLKHLLGLIKDYRRPVKDRYYQ